MLPAWHRRGSADRVPYANRACVSVRRKSDRAVTLRVSWKHRFSILRMARMARSAARQSIARIRVISVVCSATTLSAISSIRTLFPCALTSAAMVMAPS